MRNAESPERGKANFQGSFSLSFPNDIRSSLSKTNCTEAQLWTQPSLQHSSGARVQHIRRLISNYRNRRNRGNHEVIKVLRIQKFVVESVKSIQSNVLQGTAQPGFRLGLTKLFGPRSFTESGMILGPRGFSGSPLAKFSFGARRCTLGTENS